MYLKLTKEAQWQLGTYLKLTEEAQIFLAFLR
jgi:hypothetical protein